MYTKTLLFAHTVVKTKAGICVEFNQTKSDRCAKIVSNQLSLFKAQILLTFASCFARRFSDTVSAVPNFCAN